MHAKPGHPAHTALPTVADAESSPALPVDTVLSAAFSKALGGPPARPHLAVASSLKGAKAAVKDKSIGPRGRDRGVTVKPIAPRSGHR
jgi:hypothetical protein